MPATPAVELAAIMELPELDEREVRERVLPLVEVAVGELGELVTPELLTVLHGVNVLALIPKAPGSSTGGQFLERLIPPPSKVGNVIGP